MRAHFQRIGRAQDPLTYLDLFCGSGIRSFLFCHEFPQHGKVIGVDSSQEAIEIAITNADNNEGDVQFICDDVKVLDLSKVPPFDVIEMDPFGGCMSYLENCLPYLRDGGLLNLTFTNSWELFPPALADVTTYSTHGITRPHPDVGNHEFGLRSTWLALKNILTSYSKDIRPICCWAFPHGCRIIGQVCDLKPGKGSEDCNVSLYADSLDSFAFVFPKAVSSPSLSISICSGVEVSLAYLGPCFGKALFDEELLPHILELCENPIHRSVLGYLQSWSRLLPRQNTISEPMWGVFSSKKFFKNYLLNGSSSLRVPSLHLLCNILNTKFPGSTFKQDIDRDVYLTTVSVEDQVLALSEIFIHKPLRSPQEKLNHQVKRPREPQVPHSPMHNPSLVPSELSRKVLGLLHSILSFAGAMSCAGDIQAPLTELLQELQIAAPPVGFHNSVIFFLISNRDNNLQSPFVLSPSSSESNQWIECKLMVFGCLDDCLRYIENKQERIRRRIYTKKCIATHGEGSVQSRRNRRQLHRECNATPTGKRLTASIPHYIGLIDSHCSDSLSLNHSYTIFLGDAARSSFILLGNSLNTLLVNQIWETFGVVSQPLDPQSNPHTSTSIITRGSFRFVTISPSLGECLLTSSVIFSDISFKAASPTSTCLVSACGSGCKIEILNCHFLLTNDDLLSKLFPRNFSFFELKNGSSCSLVCSELYGNRFDDVCCQSLISCKCKVALKISDCQLSKSYSSLIHLQSSCSLSIVSSTLGGSQKSAIYIFDAAEVRIEKCEIFKNQKCGVEIFSNHFGSNLSSPINLLECRIHSNDESGLFLYRCRCQVSSSFFSHNGLANISCHEGTHLDLDNCVITTSSRSGVHACGKDTVVLLHDCTIGNNQEGDLDCVDGALVSIVEHNVSSEN